MNKITSAWDLYGFDGSKLPHIAKYIIHGPIHDTQIIRDIHLSFRHIVI